MWSQSIHFLINNNPSAFLLLHSLCLVISKWVYRKLIICWNNSSLLSLFPFVFLWQNLVLKFLPLTLFLTTRDRHWLPFNLQSPTAQWLLPVLSTLTLKISLLFPQSVFIASLWIQQWAVIIRLKLLFFKSRFSVFYIMWDMDVYQGRLLYVC